MVKNFDDFKKKNESMKKFSDKKKSVKVNSDNKEGKKKLNRLPDSASQRNADETNQRIINQETIKGVAQNREYNHGKEETTIQDDKIKPNEDSVFDTEKEKKDKPSRGIVGLDDTEPTEYNEGNVNIYGKVAKFPKGVKASKAYNFLYNLKDPKIKTGIWYLMVEKQDNELQMIRYHQKKGVNLSEFINELKKYYIEKYKKNTKIVEAITKIELGGDDDGNFSAIRNIPAIKVGKRKLISLITEDLIKILS